ncbi:membrane dipeptidase [Sphingomonas spermidinifaciens]|uniref:Membrane dipeptidase n=1 Tax=Sphingomonas spermidinifaciens TaxID=1141889 RepID=A0A2A4B3H3_9SPHN|nr:dipeptidase [Sphingomonas spermidinifaciens]PCD02991.1 membrane dipeptidase [Sphingomonas spermidinifaciens]
MRGRFWIGLALAAASAPVAAQSVEARLDRFLATRPVIDGHNDLPWELREKYGASPERARLDGDTSRAAEPLQTDLPRLKRGGYAAQFWSVWIPAATTGPAAVETTIEQIDIVRRMVAAHPDRLTLATTAAEVETARRAGKIASLIGAEGGGQIDGNLSILRQYRALGVLYLTLTHTRNVGWADSGTDVPDTRGLTDFGRQVIAEMNRIGMIVDLSHTSPDTMRAAIAASKAPVMFSHSNAYAVNPHPRNVPDDVLALLKANGGVVMVNVYPVFVSAKVRAWQAEKAAAEARLTGSPAGLMLGAPKAEVEAKLAVWVAANPQPPVTAADVADHVEHIARIAGRDHVGLGGDYDGISGTGPEGMKGVDGWRLLFAELMRRGWSDADLARLAGGNILRVMRRVEAVAAR